MIQLEGPDNRGIVWIKLNRPESGNSLYPTLVHELLSAPHTADRDPAMRIIILTGNGRFFCMGMDLLSPDELSFTLGDDFHQLNKILITTEKILIAAVNGFGATVLALYDLVFVVPDAYFFTPFVKWGMVPEAALSVTFLKLMGHQHAALLYLTGERIRAEEARNLGLVSKIIPANRFLDKVGDVAESLSKAPVGSLLQTKWLLKGTTIKDLLDANNRECRVVVEERIPSGDLQRGRDVFQAAQREKESKKSSL
jgi:peroxisomal 3,2-trans-enoyl-CoA isomerase